MTANPFRQAVYLQSAHDTAQFPADTGGEVAFVGRSNVGKSSVLNTLADHRGLAHTSKTPGRTRLINFFSVTADTRLVDLPGYGFAKVDRETRSHWDDLINAYLTGRQSLAGLVLIVDVRRELSAEDDMILVWAAAADVPVHVLANKADKLPYGRAQVALAGLGRSLKGRAAGFQAFSAHSGAGLETLKDVLAAWLQIKAGPG